MRFVPLVVLGIIAIAIAVVFGGQRCAAEQEQALLTTGSPASGEIVKIEDTGNRYNRDPEMVLTVEVRPEEGEPYLATVTWVLNAVDQQTYKVGLAVDVRYDPASPSDIAIVGPTAPGEATPAPGETPPATDETPPAAVP